MNSPLPARVLVFFARNPDETLLSGDLALKFGVDANNLSVKLKRLTDAGLVRSSAPGGRRQATWSAGPALLALIRSGCGEIVEAA